MMALHFAAAQSQLVLNWFLTFDQFCGSCSYKKDCIKTERLRRRQEIRGSGERETCTCLDLSLFYWVLC